MKEKCSQNQNSNSPALKNPKRRYPRNRPSIPHSIQTGIPFNYALRTYGFFFMERKYGSAVGFKITMNTNKECQSYSCIHSFPRQSVHSFNANNFS